MQCLALGLKFPRKNRPVWFSKSEPKCDYGSIKTDPEPASREKGTLDSWQKACSFCPRSKGELWTLYLASTIWDLRWFRESVPQHEQMRVSGSLPAPQPHPREAESRGNIVAQHGATSSVSLSRDLKQMAS
ncbi:predicted protein [Histoplasma capsulatum G186AR]|uniref:Uncharacterized protein n=1 Tax=Ajellomyces capsulatus (strain G186AR / H82 / ATCC MYA-2454 / RMSCC 2432) TaxID=447093 RepID=C0NKV3_AJECG|nr:uncharacterized protein HCBG_03783 [Histoplasma capsulatum G186AR]EEH08494.1 predicted protein [Histoplasma capsulatum G186AR]